ncbi:MAG: amidohydrolase family protein, partial [Clostridia bacterium]|nr:amidohydrolase family protein [Clostridia bacterium]
PAALLGLDKGRLQAGFDADILITDDTFTPKTVFVLGKEMNA